MILKESIYKGSLLNLCEISLETKWRIIYRGTIDGFETRKFHEKCDGIPRTLTIIQTTNGYVFGGYTTASWNSTGTFEADPNAYLFSLINKYSEPIKIKCSQPKTAIYCSPNYGPAFGGDDLYLTGDSDKNLSSFSNLGHSFRHPTFDYNSLEAKLFLTGAYNFQINQIEVFRQEN